MITHGEGEATGKRKTDAKAVLTGRETDKGLEDTFRILGGDARSLIGDGDGVGAVTFGMTAHQHGTVCGILVGIVEQAGSATPATTD